MVKKKINEDEFYSLEYQFPSLYRFCIKRKEITWEYINNDDPYSFLYDDHISIIKVADFSNAGNLRKYVNDLYIDDINIFRKILDKKNKNIQIKTLEHLISEAEYVKISLTSDFEYNNRTYKRFNMWCLTEEKINISHENVPDEKILSLAERFPIECLKSIDEFIGKLNYIKTHIELFNDEDDDPLTFEYIGWQSDSAKLNDLFDALCEEALLSKSENSVIDFKRVFSGKKVREKIIWQADNQDLYWFISCLKDQKLLLRPGNCWKKTCHCFLNKDHAHYEIEKLSKSHKPTNQKKLTTINNIVKDNLQIGKLKR